MTGFRSGQSGSLNRGAKQIGQYEVLERLSFRMTEEQAAKSDAIRFLRLASLFFAWDSLAERTISETSLRRLIA